MCSAASPSSPLSWTDQRALLGLARQAIDAHLAGGAPPPLPEGGAALREVRGAFVTLRARGELRGCIGHTIGRLPLAAAVRTLAVSAACRDPRFPPLQREELAALAVEVSVLSPLGLADPARIEVGAHGLVIEHQGRSGLLLPQVAAERGWDAATFLRATCRKAGLPEEVWRDAGARLSWFTCQAFAEGEQEPA